jgi:hypothetical protein
MTDTCKIMNRSCLAAVQGRNLHGKLAIAALSLDHHHHIRSARYRQGEGTTSREQEGGTILTEPLNIGAGMRPPLVCSDQVLWPMTMPPYHFFYRKSTVDTHAEREG